MKVINQREIERRVKDNGFILARVKGDHKIYKHADGRSMTLKATKMNRMVWQRLCKENHLVVQF